MDKLERFYLSHYLQNPQRNLLRFSFVFMVLGIVLSVGILSAGLNLFQGYESSLKSLLLDSFAHVSIQSSVDNYLSHSQAEAVIQKLQNDPMVLSAIPTIHYALMAGHEDKIRAAALRAYDFNNDFPYAKYISQGSPTPKSGEVIIGKYLAEELSLKLGDNINLIYPQLDRITPLGMATGQNSFTITGIYRSGFYENDRSIVICNLADAERLLLIADKYSKIEIRLQDVDKADRFAKKLSNALGAEYICLPWNIFAQSLLRLVTMEKWLIFIVFCFLVLIAGFNVISVVSTIIIDKRGEIAVLKTLGAKSSTIKRLFGWQVGLSAILAVILGQLFGALLSWIVEKQSIYHLKGDVYFIDTLGASITATNLLAVFAVASLLILLCISIPLKQIDRLQIIDMIRNKA